MAPPPWAAMWRSSCFMHRNTLVKLTAIMRSQRASSSWWNSDIMSAIPALLKAMSRRPCCETIPSTIASTAASSVTSTWRAEACGSGAAELISLTVSVAPSASRSATTTWDAP